MSIQHTDAEAGVVAVAPRVSLADIEDAIAHRFDTTADRALLYPIERTTKASTYFDPMPGLAILSMCILVMHNGFTVIGKSAPASAENFNAELGRKFAYEDAIRQLWPLMGFALRDKLSGK